MSAKPDRQTLLPLISSAEASPAKTSATRGRGPGSKGSAPGFGSSMPESFARYDRGSLLWRTSQRCLLGVWETYSGRWPNSGMMRDGVVFGPVMLEPRTGESGCSLWLGRGDGLEHPCPTPSAMDGASVSLNRTVGGWQAESERHAVQGQHKQFPLQVAVELNASEGQARRMLWPTPSVVQPEAMRNPRMGQTERPACDDNLAQSVSRFAQELWPTQSASAIAVRGQAATGGPTLEERVKHAPNLETVMALEEPSAKGAALSAAWVETLMGFPQGWTDVPPGWKPTKPTPSPRTGPRAQGKPNTHGSHRGPRAKRKTAPPG